MHMALPGWDSPEVVRVAHSRLEALALVSFAALVVFEVVAHFETKRHRLYERIGLICFSIAVLAEILAYPYGKRNDELADEMSRKQSFAISTLSNEAQEAQAKLKKALDDSNSAISKAAVALSNSRLADAAAVRALILARGAREEADSFEKDIVSAKEQAAKAEAHLAEALQRAANAEKGTATLTTRLADRTLTGEQITRIGKKVSAYAGQEFDVTPYWDLKESLSIANRIALALIEGKWKYAPPDNQGFMLGGTAGVQVWLHPDAPDKVKQAATALVSALNAEGIDTEIRQQNPKNPVDSKIHLNVGTKL